MAASHPPSPPVPPGRPLRRPRPWQRLRFQLLLVAATLLAIPWAAYHFMHETERFLREAQARELRSIASTVANVMHGLDNAFHGIAKPGSVLTYRNLFLHRLDKAPQLDGYRDEWPRFEPNFTVLNARDDALETRIFLGVHDRYVYLLLGVRDPSSGFGVDGDAVELALLDATGALRRYRLQAQAPGLVLAQRRPVPGGNDDNRDETGPIEPAIRGEWQPHPDGYTLELRLPRERLHGRLSLTVIDSRTGQMLASGRSFPAASLGHVVEASPRVQQVLDELTPPATRLWVTDHQGLVLARSGQLDASAPLHSERSRPPWFVRDLILALLPRDADAVAPLSPRRTQLFIAPVVEALAGRPSSLRRRPPGGDAVVVSAAAPIHGGDGIRGAVLVEQTTSAVLSIENLTLQRLFGVTVLLFTLTTVALLGFAAVLVARITRLRDRVEGAVGDDGRIVGRLAADRGRDEIADMTRRLDRLLERLAAYNGQLETTAERLAGELRAPLSDLRRTLDSADSDAAPAVLDRARAQVATLAAVLERVRASATLQRQLRLGTRERLDLAALVRLRIARLRTLHPDDTLTLRGCDRALPVDAVPELLLRAIDGLVAYAAAGHDAATPIETTCRGNTRWTEVAVAYAGRHPSAAAGSDPGAALNSARLIAEYHGGAVRTFGRRTPGRRAVALRLPTPPRDGG